MRSESDISIGKHFEELEDPGIDRANGGRKASDIKRLKELEEENKRLKKLYVDISLENWALKDVISKNSEIDGDMGDSGPCPGGLHL